MAKISIDDRIEKAGKVHILSKDMRDHLYDAASASLERLGDSARRLIEVIKINPECADPGVELITVKVVIAYADPYSGDKTRIERGFHMFCKENLNEFLSQGVVRNFQEALAVRAAQCRKEDELLRDALANLGLRETDSGNANRCRVCGTMCNELPDKQLVCPRCTPTTVPPNPIPYGVAIQISPPMLEKPPTCPNCGHVGVRNGAMYKCLNCGESLGAG